MRITNKIMQNNSLMNINNNKVMQDKLNTQMATGSVLTRPSDDPVVAIRAMRLSTNVTKLEQYSKKNAEDAENWLSVTEEAIDSVTELLEDMYSQCDKAVNDEKNTSNYRAIIEKMKALRDEIYACGDADYAGRNLFTGYRTESRLSFLENTSIKYSIHEEFTLEDLEERSYLDTGDVMEYSNAGGFTSDETDVVLSQYQRIRLSYQNLDQALPVDLAYNYTDPATGTEGVRYVTFMPKSSTDAGAYEPADDEAFYLADTGELVLGKNAVMELSGLPKDTVFTVSYDKSSWEKGDLRPEHYFDCEAVDGDGNLITYQSGSKQDIYYDLGANQTLKVNTNANEVFFHDIGRDVDDLETMVNQLEKIDDIVTSLEKKIAGGLDGTELEDAQLQLAAAQKAQDLKRDQIQKLFSSTITSMQGYSDQVGIALTGVGTKGNRLDLIKNRLNSQRDTFKELLQENTQKDIEETTTELASVKLAYDAALSATAKILENSLMDYI